MRRMQYPRVTNIFFDEVCIVDSKNNKKLKESKNNFF
jgi:hypothetical protein